MEVSMCRLKNGLKGELRRNVMIGRTSQFGDDCLSPVASLRSEKLMCRKLDLYILPVLGACYTFYYVDKTVSVKAGRVRESAVHLRRVAGRALPMDKELMGRRCRTPRFSVSRRTSTWLAIDTVG